MSKNMPFAARLWLRKWAANMHLDFGGKNDNLHNICKLIRSKRIIGPDRLESIIFDIIDKKIYNAPSRLLL